MRKLLLALFAVAMIAPVALAASTPIKLSLWDKIAVPAMDTVYGLELGIGSYTPELKGVSWNFIYSKTDNAIGWQAAFVSLTNDFCGLQSGCVNINSGEIQGVQYGFFNKAQSVKGLQLGFVNMTDDMQGIQIGLVNFIKTGTLPVMVIVNAKF